MNSKTLVLVAAIVAAAVALTFYLTRGPKVTVPNAGPAVVEENIPSDPEARAAFERRKAASACRVAILQNAKDPATVSFSEELDATPGVQEPGGDYVFTFTVTAKDTQPLTRLLNCRARQQDGGWGIVELTEPRKQ